MIFKVNMIKHLLIIFFLLLFHSIESSYHYAGCFTRVFYDSLFTSSYMEPTLCFRLCDTPIIYLQKTICRCSGAGLMHYNRQEDRLCNVPCSTAANPRAQTKNTCGGEQTYSAYVEEQFYLRHGHLFNYQINFFACELWKTLDVYDTVQINLDLLSIDSSLNKMEQCAAACLDQNVTTKSIAFNDDNNKCLCIFAWKSYTILQRSNYITILPNNSCNRYCNMTSEESKAASKFQCGSLTNPRIWAIYDLNGTCPIDFKYIKEMNKCIHTYKHYWNSCTPPSKSFVYDGSLTWEQFIKIIDLLKLSQETVNINFHDNISVNSSWKCLKTTTETWSSYYSHSSYGYFHWNVNTRYVLVNGCLKQNSYSQRYSYRLCLTDPLNKYSSADSDHDDDDDDNTNAIIATDRPSGFCPMYWLDLNGRCYRMSDERKTIQQARNSCIKLTDKELNKNDRSHLWNADHDDEDNDDDDGGNDDEQLDQTPTGEIVQYSSEWQSRLGFFLSDGAFQDKIDIESTTEENLNIYYEELVSPQNDTINSPITTYNDFQMIEPIDPNTTVINMNNSSCIIATRLYYHEEERPSITVQSKVNCTYPRRVLCETKNLIVQNYQYGCFAKPLTLDLPTLISTHLTYELCLTVCRELFARFAVIQLTKCYCIDSFTTGKFNLTEDLIKYKQTNCGYSCSGNHHEQCGNENTIIIFHILGSRNKFISTETNSDFVYDSCIYVKSFDPTETYQFTLLSQKDIHPRHCLKLCMKYQQNYGLLQSNQCFCTNLRLKFYDNDDQTDILQHEQCSQKCTANYFYSCGNQTNSSIYSMYKVQSKCRHNFEVSSNNQQCVYSHFSTKKSSFAQAKSYCESLGATIASVKDISKIQDILPESILYNRLLKSSSLVLQYNSFEENKYFWFDRTYDSSDNSSLSKHLLDKCSQLSKDADEHCLVIRLEKKSDENQHVYRQCIDQSNECSIQSAIPVCIDQSIEIDSIVLPSTKTDTDVSVSISSEYNCDDDDYHFVDDYCYKLSFHETLWTDAKSECEREGASLFVPEKSTTLKIIKSLFLRQISVTPSGFAHVGVIYDEQNRTIKQYISTNNSQIIQIIPDSNTVYDLCEKTFHERYSTLFSSKNFTIKERNTLKRQQIGCAYIDLLSYAVPLIRCDEIPCNRTATVICQKLPTVKTDFIRAKRKVMDSPSEIFQESNKSIARDFAPIFFILSIFILLIILALISTFYNYHLYGRNYQFFQNRRRNTNGIYSQLTSSNEFDLN